MLAHGAHSRSFARCPSLEKSIEVLAADPGRAQDVAECASLDRLVAVDGDGDRIGDIRVAHDVMAAPPALQALNGAANPLAGCAR